MTLTTRTVTNTGDPLCAPDGTPLAGITITFTLSNARGLPIDAWDSSTGERVTGTKTATTDASGEFSVALWPTDRSNTPAQYLCRASLPSVRNFMASLPSGESAFSWGQLLASGLPLTAQQLDILDTYRAGFDAAAAAAAENAAKALAIFGDAADVAAAVGSVSADAEQVARDKQSANEDRLQTGRDRTATGQDKDATAADRLQTGLDRAAAADSALLAAQDGAGQVALAAEQVSLATEQAALATSNGAAQVALATVQAGLSADSAIAADGSASSILSVFSTTTLADAKLDVDHIAEIATSLAPTATDRFGHVKQTLSAASNAVALTAAGQTTVARIAAEEARDAAQAAALASAVALAAKDTIAIGRASVADNVTFWVKPNAIDGLARYTNYLRTSGTTQTFVADQVIGAEFDAVIGSYPDPATAHAFVDAEGKVLASIKSNGEADFTPSPATKALANYLTLTGDETTPIAFTDAEGRIMQGWDANGERLVIPELQEVPGYAWVVVDAAGKIIKSIDVNGVESGVGLAGAPSTSADLVLSAQQLDAWPASFGSAVSVHSFDLSQARLVLASIAVGKKPIDGPAPTIAITDAGYTHPKVVYAPGGWNGFKFWMAITPYNGVVGATSQYENPHIFCSLDGVMWQEPTGGQNPIEFSTDAPMADYWSDTHLALGDDGFMYVWFRGNGGNVGGRGIFSKRTRDGINWTARKLVHSTDSLASVDATNLMLSPAFLQTGNVWTNFDVMRTSDSAMVIAPQKNQHFSFVFRRNALRPDDSYGEYDPDTQIINFTNMPWGAGKDPWHLDVCKVGNMWFTLLNIGANMSSGASDQWLAYSKDGWNFTVFPDALMIMNTYRSCIVPIGMADGLISFYVYLAKLDGTINLYNLKVKVA